ncbi:hypothetical protein [Planomonospora parontospora]|uniref:hypothetical protein n=1 Tax=Planomonospora parontospora TaxID=58119 RepID=UPI001940D40B|nr:hypothetical protein [Planomonospora parontospora]GGL15568.1 hypothetical protein GCM10014719_17040 [Planomonospora parontospora subsp. antibiotica]GII15978.1 hypothetical protein Ppa05_27040 [Planomonospora parontospora subsp. antibiotica]
MTAPVPNPNAGSGSGPASGPHEPPERRGLRTMVLGSILAVLAPLAGFLGGSMAGHGSGVTGLSPLFLWMFGGLIIGAVGAVVAITGGLRWARARHTRQASPQRDH